MTENIREFLLRFTEEELTERGILRGQTCILQGTSVDPLLALMKEQNVKRIEFPLSNWFLDVDYSFNNPHSVEHLTNIKQLRHLGSVFNLQNVHVNPYYQGRLNDVPRGADDEIDSPIAAEETTIRLESHLQSVLRDNIEQLEPGLRIIDGGTERTVTSGRIDITAQDLGGRLVVVELKAVTAPASSLTQVLAFMVALAEEESKPARGILVAPDFHYRVVLAAKAIPNLQLSKYSVRFQFENP